MNEIDYRKIGLSIKEHRKKLKITQKELGEKIGKVESTIRKYEKGLVQIPNDVLEKLSKLFNISVFELISNETPKPQEKNSENSFIGYFDSQADEENHRSYIRKVVKVIEITEKDNNILIEAIKNNIRTIFNIELDKKEIEILNRDIKDCTTVIIAKLLYDKQKK